MKRSAEVTKTNEAYGPYRRYNVGDGVAGPEADRLVQLGLAEYNDEEPQEVSPEPSPEPSLDDDTEEKES